MYESQDNDAVNNGYLQRNNKHFEAKYAIDSIRDSRQTADRYPTAVTSFEDGVFELGRKPYHRLTILLTSILYETLTKPWIYRRIVFLKIYSNTYEYTVIHVVTY